MIRFNDRLDPMTGWAEIPGALPADAPSSDRRAFIVPQGEFSARLTTSGAISDRFSIMFGDPDAAEGEAPDVWRGVVEAWQPAGSNVSVTCRPARTVHEAVGGVLPSGAVRRRVGGV
jgi:hypothetical protein